MVRPARLELATPSFVGWCSVQLSYRRARGRCGTFNYSSEEIGPETSAAKKRWREMSRKNAIGASSKPLAEYFKRSEERRVGKECRSQRAQEHEKEKRQTH